MSAMKDYLMDQICDLAGKTGYSDEFLMNAWFENSDTMTWEQFRAAVLNRELVKVSPMADVLWMITVSPDCKRPVVRCAEMEKPFPFAVTITNKDFTGLPGLVADALQKVDALRRAAKGAAV